MHAAGHRRPLHVVGKGRGEGHALGHAAGAQREAVGAEVHRLQHLCSEGVGGGRGRQREGVGGSAQEQGVRRLAASSGGAPMGGGGGEAPVLRACRGPSGFLSGVV